MHFRKNRNGNKPKILVIGDLILDVYIQGTCDRISPEAPVPVVLQKSSEFKLGGAANVAANISSVGCDVDLIGATGRCDKEGIVMEHLCKEKNINPFFFQTLIHTTVKRRIIADGQQMIRIDSEDTITDIKQELSDLSEFEKDYDIVIVSDYAKGFISMDLMKALKSLDVPIIVDPKPQNIEMYNGVYLMTPNEKEFDMMKSNPFPDKCDNLLVTLGPKGMTLSETGNCTNIPSNAKEVYDVTGAGDTVVAIIAVCLASQLDLLNSCKIANQAAAITISHHGTSSITYPELVECHKIITKRL